MRASLVSIRQNLAYEEFCVNVPAGRGHVAASAADSGLAIAVAEPVEVTSELGALAEQLEHRGIRLLREVLGRPLSRGPTDVTASDAARITETYRALLASSATASR